MLCVRTEVDFIFKLLVSASIWEGQQCKRVELTLLDMSSAIINKMVRKSCYQYISLIFVISIYL